MKNPSSELLEECRKAWRSGKTLPEVWIEILKRHEMVVDLPVQQLDDGEPVLEIKLRTGERLICGRNGYRIVRKGNLFRTLCQDRRRLDKNVRLRRIRLSVPPTRECGKGRLGWLARHLRISSTVRIVATSRS